MSATVVPDIVPADVPGDSQRGPRGVLLEPLNGWQKVIDEEGDAYYWHTGTDETTWVRPAGFTGDGGAIDRGGAKRKVNPTEAWEEEQRARIDEEALEHKAAVEADETEEKERRGSVIWQEMVGIRKSAGLRKQSVTELYLKLKNRVVEGLKGKSETNDMKIEPAAETDDDKIAFYLTGESPAKMRLAFLNKQERQAKRAEEDQVEKEEEKRKERVRLKKEQEEAAIRAAQEVERLTIKMEQLMKKAATERAMNQEDGGEPVDAWPLEDKTSLWIEPTKAKAKSTRRQAMYQFGKASLFETTVTDVGRDMGPGVLLYFQLLAMLFAYFILATLLTLPVLLINMEGRGLEAGASTSWVAMFMPTVLGNQGISCTPPEVWDSVSPECMFCLENAVAGVHLLGCGNSTAAVCATLSPPDLCAIYITNTTNTTTGEVTLGFTYPNPTELQQTKVVVPMMGVTDSSTAAMIIMVCDLLVTILFLKAVAMYKVHIDHAIAQDDEAKISAADYTVWVTGLPLDATEEGVFEHFNEQYDCTCWDYYPTHLGCLGGKKMYEGLEPLGRYKKVPKRLQPRVVQNTTHFADPSSKRAMMYKGSWIAEVTIVRPLESLLGLYEDHDEVAQQTKEAHRLQKKYSPGSQWAHYASAFQNGSLRNRRRKADVVVSKCKGKEPAFQRLVAKMSAAFDETPQLLPVINLKDEKEVKEAARQAKLDAQAKAKRKDRPMDTCVGAFVTFNNEESAAVCLANYSSSSARCMGYNFGLYWQPRGLRYQEQRASKGAYDGHRSWADTYPLQVERAREPEDLRWEHLEYDFVKRHIRTRARRKSTFLTFMLLLFSFVFLLMMSKAPSVPLIVSSVIVSTVNTWLEDMMYSCTDTEHHSSNSSYTTSIGIKIFVACFINTALVTLFVGGKLPNNIDFPLASFGVFGGTVTEYNREWYSGAGQSIMLTMFVNAIEPNVTPLCEEVYYAFNRFRQTITGGSSFSSQRQMNLLFAPTDIEMEARYALILNTVFCCLFFSAGLPILWLFGAVSMATIYITDWYMLLRCYKQPYFDPSFAKVCCTLLPYAALLHLINGFWMLGCRELLMGSLSPLAQGQTFSFISDILYGLDPFGAEGFAAKVEMVHTLPYAVLMAVWLIRLMLPGWLVHALTSFANAYAAIVNFGVAAWKCQLCSGEPTAWPFAIDLEQTPFSAYTEPFEQCAVDGTTVRTLSKKEEDTGWEEVEENAKEKKKKKKKADIRREGKDEVDDEGACVSIVRVWMRGGQHNSGQLVNSKATKSVVHNQGERMLTWRAMPTLASYDIMANPKYGRLLEDCPFFDQEKLAKARAKLAKMERAREKMEVSCIEL
jgi:RNA recognition motif-containing protein